MVETSWMKGQLGRKGTAVTLHQSDFLWGSFEFGLGKYLSGLNLVVISFLLLISSASYYSTVLGLCM